MLHLAPFLWSGAGQVITSLCDSQSARHTVAIATSGRSRGQSDWPGYRARLARAGIRHARIDLFDRKSETFWTAVERLGRLIESFEPDVVHAHAGVPSSVAAVVRTTTGAAFALVSHVYSWGVGRPEWMNRMDAWGHGQADVVVCSARAYEQALIDRGVARSRVVRLRWGLAPESLAGAPASRTGSGGRGPVIGFVGRLEPRKGQLDLVRLFARVRARCPRARLELVGPSADPVYTARIRAAIADAGLGAAVRLRGRVRSVPAAVAGWDLFVSLSRDEGQGLAILEAMALGVPVASLLVAGVEDYLQPGVTGIELPGRSTRTLAAAVTAALEDRAWLAAIGRAGRTWTRTHCAWNTTVHAIDELYDRVRRHRRAA